MTDDFEYEPYELPRARVTGTQPRPLGTGGQRLDNLFRTVATTTPRVFSDEDSVRMLGYAYRNDGFGYVPPRRQGSGRAAPPAPTYKAQPPQRYQVNLLGDIIDSAPGRAFLGTPGAQRGGVVPFNTGFGPNFGLATAPVDFQNYATWAREAPLAALTSMLGHKYQQPTTPFTAPTGPQNTDDILTNIGQLDLEGALDNVIDAAWTVGDAINAPFVAMSDWVRNASAHSRARDVAALARSGSVSQYPGFVPGQDLIGMALYHLGLGEAPSFSSNPLSWFTDGDKRDMAKVRAKARERGIDDISMVAQLYDLPEEIVRDIFTRGGGVSDDELAQLSAGIPFSFDPGTNLLLELGVSGAPMLLGGYGIVRAPMMLKGLASSAGLTRAAGQFAGFTRATTRAAEAVNRVAQANRVTQAAAWSLPKIWKASGILPTKEAYALGGTIRAGEWMFKQMAELVGNDEAVAMVDRWLWETPLSTSPGLMLVDAFNVPFSPLTFAGDVLREGPAGQTVGRLRSAISGVSAKLSPRTATRLGAANDLPVDVLAERFLEPALGWDRDLLHRLYDSPGAPLSTSDLRNGLLQAALQIVRSRHPESAHMWQAMGALDRQTEFITRYGEEAARLFIDAVEGKPAAQRAFKDAITDEFWTRDQVRDTNNPLGRQPQPGPYDPAYALRQFSGWIRASNEYRAIHPEAVPALRHDIDPEFATLFKAELRRVVPDPAGQVPDNLVREAVLHMPVLSMAGPGLRRGRSGRMPKVTRKQLEGYINDQLSRTRTAEAEEAAPRRAPTALREADVEDPAKVAKAFNLSVDTVRRLMGEQTSPIADPIPGDLVKLIERLWGHELIADRLYRPERVWERAREWFGAQLQSAVARGVALDALEAFRVRVASLPGGLKPSDESLFAIMRDALQRPLQATEARLTSFMAERDAQVIELMDQVAAWLEDPLAGATPVQLSDAFVMLAIDGFEAADARVLMDLAARAARQDGLAPARVAELGQPTWHPLEKVAAIREAIDAGMTITPEERVILDHVPTLDAYAALMPDRDPSLGPVTRDEVFALTEAAANHHDALPKLLDQMRGMAGLVRRGVEEFTAPDVRDFITRMTALSHGVRDERGRAAWMFTPIDPEARRVVATRYEVAWERRMVESRLRDAEKDLTRVTGDLDRLNPLVTATLRMDDFDFEPVARFETQKEAVGSPAFEQIRAEGFAPRIVTLTKVGEHRAVPGKGKFLLERGAPRPGAASEPAATGTPEPGAISPDEPTAPVEGPRPAEPAEPLMDRVRREYDEWKAKVDALAGEEVPRLWVEPNGTQHLLTADMRPSGAPWRVTRIDPDGTPTGHLEFSTYREAIEYGIGTRGELRPVDGSQPAQEAPGAPIAPEVAPEATLTRMPEPDPFPKVTLAQAVARPERWIANKNRVPFYMDELGNLTEIDTPAKGHRLRKAYDAALAATTRLGDPIVFQVEEVARQLPPGHPARVALEEALAAERAADAALDTPASVGPDSALAAYYTVHQRLIEARRAITAQPSVVEMVDDLERARQAEIAATENARTESEALLDAHSEAWRAKYAAAPEPEPAPAPTGEVVPERVVIERAAGPVEQRVVFMDPGDNATPISARLVVVDLDDLLTSDMGGYPANLQPRSRDIRATSARQIADIAKQPNVDELLGTTKGANGTPIVTADGVVLAGNGRIMGLRQATDEAFGPYYDRLVAEGFADRPQTGRQVRRKKDGTPDMRTTQAVLAAMPDPPSAPRPRKVLVRVLDPMDQTTLERLAWQLNPGMPLGDLAPALAGEITAADLGLLKIGDATDLDAALLQDQNAQAVARIIGHLPVDERPRFYDGNALTQDGQRLVKASLLAKVLRADDRTLPGFEARRQVVFAAAESTAEEIKSILAGVSQAAGQMIGVQNKAELGTIGREFLQLTDDLGPALGRLLELSRDGLDRAGMLVELDQVGMFSSLTPHQTHLAKVLAASKSAAEVKSFFRGVAEAADNAPAEGQVDLFGGDLAFDYPALLNEGLRRWNEGRPDNAKLMPFPDARAPYDTPLTPPVENELGTLAPGARASVPLATEEVAGDIARRIAGEDAVAIVDDFGGLDHLPEGAAVRMSDPMLQRMLDDALNRRLPFLEELQAVQFAIERRFGRTHRGPKDPPTPPDEYARIVAHEERVMDEGHAELLAKANDGTASGAEIAYLYALSGGLWRRNEAGQLNMPRATNTYLAGLAALPMGITRVQHRIRTASGAERTRVIVPREQRPITPEQAAADMGPDVPTEAFDAEAADIAKGAEHAVVVGTNPALNRAIGRATGAVLDDNRRVVEFRAPELDQKVAALEAARLEAIRARDEAAKAVEDFDPSTVLPERDTVFPSDELADAWARLMHAGGRDNLAYTFAEPIEPSEVGEVVDAIESIDRGFLMDPRDGIGITPEEGAQLRGFLMGLLETNANRYAEELVQTTAPAGTRRMGRVAREAEEADPDFDVQSLRDRAREVMGELARQVKYDPDNPLAGFEAIRYEPALTPTGQPGTGGPMTPRLILSDWENLLPGLGAELESRRMMTLPARSARARLAKLLDAIAGARPEQEIRRRALSNFGRELRRFMPEDLEGAAVDEFIDELVSRSFTKWLEAQDDMKLGPYRIFRRIDLMGDELVNKVFWKAADEIAGGNAQAQPWAKAMAEAGETPARLWQRADNRLRNWIAESDLPLSEQLEALYGKVAHGGRRLGSRWLNVAYHLARFTTEVRWLALEAMEPFILTFTEGGVRPVLAAGPLRNTKLGRKAQRTPLAFGKEQIERAFGEYAHWAALTDLEAPTSKRQRYLVAELANRQHRPLEEAVKEMAAREPRLRQLMEAMGDRTPDDFLRRLERDWELAELSTTKLTAEQAERVFGKWRGVIPDAQLDELIRARKYVSHPAIDAELAKVVGDPVATALYERLRLINNDLFHQLTNLYFGQHDRSNLQRALNHPLLYWPVSYQIKATKWLLRFMTERAFGLETRGGVGYIIQGLWNEHRQRFAEDERYRAEVMANDNLFFMAQMLLPISPLDIGVSLAPWTRMAIDPEYQRTYGIFGWGPFQTFGSMVPRLLREQRQPGGLLEDVPGGERLDQAFPLSISVRPTGRSREEQSAQRLIGGLAEPVPYEEPAVARLP